MDLALIILDGWGLADHDQRNAIQTAETPNFDRYFSTYPSGRLKAAGKWVGLPDGQASNSEVGHMNIGAGRLVKQAYTRVNEAIETGELKDNNAINWCFEQAKEHDSVVHFMGLVSDGGVHSDMSHLFALIELAAEENIGSFTHVFTDGRDASPKGGQSHVQALQEVVDETGNGHPATVMGRYYAMDRNENWERTKTAYDAVVHRDAEWEAESAYDAVVSSYDRGDTDEFIEPTLIEGGPRINNGDSVFFFNFREDRARQIIRMLSGTNPVWDFDTTPPELNIATLTEYDDTFDFPVAFPPTELEATLGEVLSVNNLTQLRMAESEKYAHVTYFLNGGQEVEFAGETREIIPSPDVPTFDLQPEMNAKQLTDSAIAHIEDSDPDVLIINYANPDMVGHTGDFAAAIDAVETVDMEFNRLVEYLHADGAHVLVTSDHGNAEILGTAEEPNTAHTTSDVPFVYISPTANGQQKCITQGGSLRDIAPTILELLDVQKPEQMSGESLIDTC